jgi:peptidoglycan/xylan/chitin deacetylase (PgdA/CDA1 family)
MDSVMPYKHEGTDVIELPVHWILDDAAHFWFDEGSWSKKISTNSEVEEIWLAEFKGIAALGGIAVLTCHPQIIGRPGRLPLLESIIERAKADGAWVATCGEIADYVRTDEALASERGR